MDDPQKEIKERKRYREMASSSYNPYVPFPYPSHVCAPNFVTFTLSGRDEYDLWKTQMLCLLESHGMLGFIDGTLMSPQRSVSGDEKVGDHQTHHYMLWRRSDALVKGWIFGSLSKQTLRHVLNRLTKNPHHERNAADFSAKDVWDGLQILYGPPQVLFPDGTIPFLFKQGKMDGECIITDKQEEDRTHLYKRFYRAKVKEHSYLDDLIEKTRGATMVEKISNNGDTALHVAVGITKNEEFLEKFMEKIPENTQLLDVRNSDGSTLLHVAAIVGNTEAAKILVEKNPGLLYAEDNQLQTPLALSLSNMHTEMSKFLMDNIAYDIGNNTLFSGTSGDNLLVTAISSKDFSLAHHLANFYQTLHSDAALVALAQNFPRKLTTLEIYLGTNIMHHIVKDMLKTAIDGPFRRCFRFSHCLKKTCRLLRRVLYWIIMLFPLILKMSAAPFVKHRVQACDDARELLSHIFHLITREKNSKAYHLYYTNPILEATRLNAYHVVDKILYDFPYAISSANEDGHNVIQYAVVCRSEKIYNLLYTMSEHKNVYRTIKDSSGNNLLHLAARLAPSNKLNLISGAALQIQRELQWFKAVEGFVCPLNIIQKNSFGETPQMLFTREHENLVIEGEKWMKATAKSYTITAALVTTIVFAAAITVPGGNNQAGIPVFTNNTAFTVFAISDAISLFAAVTSLLMFLSILTSRFAEQDFLLKLPTQLIIGLATLFISMTTMIVAFGATLYIVFGQSNSKILTSIVVLTCLPITSFVALQFRLVIDLMSATFGRSIFGMRIDS